MLPEKKNMAMAAAEEQRAPKKQRRGEHRHPTTTNMTRLRPQDVFADVVAPTLFHCIIDTPVFATLRGIPRLGGLSCVFPEELGEYSLYDTTLRLVQLATQWATRMRPWCGSTPQDRLCVELAALISQLGQRSWLYQNCVHGASSERSAGGVLEKKAEAMAVAASSTLSIELFKTCVLSNPMIAVQLEMYGLGAREMELTYSFLRGSFNDNHSYSLVLHNGATSIDAKTLELCLCLSAYWRTRDDVAYLAWTEAEVNRLLDGSGAVVAADGTMVMAFERWTAPLLQKLYAGVSHFQTDLNTHADLHAMHLFKAELDAAEVPQRVACRREWPFVAAERFVYTAPDVSTAGYEMMCAHVFSTPGVLLEDWVVSTMVYNCTADVLASRVYALCSGGGDDTTTGLCLSPFNLCMPASTVTLPLFGVVRLFRRRPVSHRTVVPPEK